MVALLNRVKRGVAASARRWKGRFRAAPYTKTYPINMGDLFWDKDHDWCDGSDDLDVVYLILSCDREPADGVYYYRCAFFMWCVGRYCGAHDRLFTEGDVMKMTKVGNIASIKGFPK